MTAKQIDLRARKDIILGIAIEQYIEMVSPVSSAYIADKFSLDLSSATIRNILADLEEDGYLTHPHTSAGRIPTEKGYRYYVDHLMNEIQLLEVEKHRIKSEYARQSLALERILEKTSQMISDMTHYTSIISVDGGGNRMYCHGTSFVVNYPDYQDLAKIQNILSALDEKEKLLEVINQDIKDKLTVYIGREIAYASINSCSLVVSSYRSKEGPSGRIAVLGPTRMNYRKVVSALDYLTDVMENFLSK